MVPAEFAEPQFITYAIGALIQLSAAIWLFSIAPGDPRHRSFAVLVTLNAVWDVLEGLYFSAAAPRDDYYLRVYTYLAIWSAAALVWFLSLYPTRRASSSWIGWASLGTAAALSTWYAVDHTAAETPLFSLVSLGWTPLLTLGAYLCLRRPLAKSSDPRAWSMILVACAFLVYPLSQAVTLLSPAYWSYLTDNVAGATSVSGGADAIVEIAYLAARLAAVALLVLAIQAATRQPSASTGKATFLATMLGAVVLARVLDLLGVRFPALNAVVFGIVIAYALARARLFDVDLRLKFTISRGAVVAFFTFVFILVSQVIEAFFEEEFGQNYVIAGAACGLLLFALGPLQRYAERLADRALPTVERTPSYEQRRRREVYRAALADAWHDGTITVKERRLLDALAQHIGIKDTEAATLEIEVVKALSEPARKASG